MNKNIKLLVENIFDDMNSDDILLNTINMAAIHQKQEELKRIIETGDNDELRKIAIGDFVIPEGTTKIGREAFSDCKQLTSITIPNTVKQIEYLAFDNCQNLTSINIPNSVVTINTHAFDTCISITDLYIDNNKYSNICFMYGLSNLRIKNVVFGKNVTEIEPYAFQTTQSLTNITIPDSVIKIGNYAFFDCNAAQTLNIGNSVETINDYAFAFCKSLTKINIPSSVTYIGIKAFAMCNQVTTLIINNASTKIDMEAFKGCSSLKTVIFNSDKNIIHINSQAFQDCPDDLIFYVKTNEQKATLVKTGFKNIIIK